jgi:plastocyanin
MHFSKATLLNLIPAVLAAGTVHQVTVGPSNTLTFSPNTINAAVGDSVQFNFATQNHTVTAGNPNVGCSPSGQFYSGFVPAPGAANTNANANANAQASVRNPSSR